MSKKFNDTQMRYPVSDKEMMAIVEAFKEWKHYLLRAKHTVIVYTDHSNLTAFTTTKQLRKSVV